MRENMNSVMAGMEDGLILFTREARRSWSALPPKSSWRARRSFSGPTRERNLSHGHPLHQVLQIEGDELSEIAAETDLQTVEGPKRVSVSVQSIQEDGERMAR